MLKYARLFISNTDGINIQNNRCNKNLDIKIFKNVKERKKVTIIKKTLKNVA